jgi:hypothetical protein
MDPLNYSQKATICEIAREAWDLWEGRDEFTRRQPAGADAFVTWRHQQQLAAVGLQSLTLCTQEQYRDLLRHFLKLRDTYRAEASTLSLFQP